MKTCKITTASFLLFSCYHHCAILISKRSTTLWPPCACLCLYADVSIYFMTYVLYSQFVCAPLGYLFYSLCICLLQHFVHFDSLFVWYFKQIVLCERLLRNFFVSKFDLFSLRWSDTIQTYAKRSWDTDNHRQTKAHTPKARILKARLKCTPKPLSQIAHINHVPKTDLNHTHTKSTPKTHPQNTHSKHTHKMYSQNTPWNVHPIQTSKMHTENTLPKCTPQTYA